jgi:hypothetical protein
METLGNQIMPKLCPNYYCNFCHYGTSKKSSYDNHNLSAKHIKSIKINGLETVGTQIMPKLCSSKYSCEICNKEFKNRSGLWKHKNKNICNKNATEMGSDSDDEGFKNEKDLTDKDLIMMLIKENGELKNMIMKVLENGTHNSNSHNTTNSHNKSFNLQFFLNETCKDAMNITDFVDSLKLQLSDLEGVGELGYVEGISNIIVRNLNELDVTQRPVHCTDKKRETIYIKDEDKWEKDEENKKMHKFVKKVADKNARLLLKFKEKYPDYKKSSSPLSDQYNKILIESMGGSGDNDFEKEEKIIKRIAKKVFVEK